MTLLVAFIGAVGIWLCYSGITGASRSLAARVTPYVVDRRGGLPGASAGRPAGPKGILLRVLNDAKPGSSEALAQRLKAAGSGLGADEYRVEQLTWAASGAGVAAALPIAGWMSALSVNWSVIPLIVAIGAITGFFARDWHLGRETSRRQAACVEQLPVAIDLITISLMAGSSVAAGCKRVADVMSGGIGDEFSAVWGDIRSGATVVEALEGFGRRIPHPTAMRFVDAVATGIERGAPLADVLRAQADDARDARRRALLEMGGRKEVVMLVPVVFLILPVVVTFALWPGLVTLDLLVP